jgi:cysteine-S-conjugate beta-lyase
MTPEHQRQRGGLKWTYYADDVLPAWVAEMDFGLAPAVSQTLHDAVDRGLTGYSYPDAEMAMAEAAVGFWADRFDWKVDPTWVFPAPDVIEGIKRCIVHLTRPGTPVVLHTPVYFPFFSMVERAGREIIEVPSPTDPEGRYTLDLIGIEQALRSGAGSIVLCNPWNPTGRVLDRAEIEDLISLATRYRARVIADEIHSPIIYDGAGHTPVATVDPECTMTVTAASKAWNLPGLKCAQVVLTCEADREVWESYYEPHLVGVGTFGVLASEAAYSRGREWLSVVLRRLVTNRDLLTRLVAEYAPKTVLYPPEGTYLAWLDMSAYGVDNPARFLKEEARVALNDGEPFRGGSAGFVRVNFATDTEVIIELVERIGKALRQL